MRTFATRRWAVAMVTVGALGLALAGCRPGAAGASGPTGEGPPAEEPTAEGALVPVKAFPELQLTGVTVSRTGRTFVNFPRWGGAYRHAVVEVKDDGALVPYPDATWNTWGPRDDPARRFVCVQSVVADGRGTLWILDPASPGFRGVVEGGAKLVRVDLAKDRVTRVYPFPPEIAPKDGYLNDVRIDHDRDLAYITDSGNGALVVLDLATGEARRLLDDHPSTHAEPDVVPVIGGRELRGPKGAVPAIHADGIAFDPARGLLYWHALTGRHLYRIETVVLADRSLDDAAIGERVRDLGETVVTDGLVLDERGRVLHTALEKDAIIAWDPRDGRLRTVVQDPALRWPDSLAWGPDGALYVTTSQIHLTPRFAGEGARSEPFMLFRVSP